MSGHPPRLRLQLAADALSVPGARRFVVDGLVGWGQEQYVDAAELVVSELTGNAALHSGASYMYLTLERGHGNGVRVVVEDDGPVAADVVHASARASTSTLEWHEHQATGRGLAIVAMLAEEWGVDDTARGKQVWASLVDPQATYPVRPPRRSAAGAPDPPAGELPADWVLVRLVQCPVDLSLEQDRHLDELVRELQLLATDGADPASAAIAEQIRGLLISPAHARLAGRRAAERARAEGRAAVDVEMAMPRAFSTMVVQLQEAVSRADELCDQGQLLALTSSPALRELRAWMTHEIVAQATQGAAPVPWPHWRATEPQRRTDGSSP